jgi:hypothetical protein
LWELSHFRCTVYTRIVPTDVQVVTLAVVVKVIMSQPSSDPGSIPAVSTQLWRSTDQKWASWIEMGAARHPCTPSPGTAGIQVAKRQRPMAASDVRLQRALRELGDRPGIIWDEISFSVSPDTKLQYQLWHKASQREAGRERPRPQREAPARGSSWLYAHRRITIHTPFSDLNTSRWIIECFHRSSNLFLDVLVFCFDCIEFVSPGWDILRRNPKNCWASGGKAYLHLGRSPPVVVEVP